MPSLDPEHRKLICRFLGYNCSKCGQRVYRDYCRQCDEFLFECQEGCPNNDTEHIGHRRYPREGNNAING